MSSAQPPVGASLRIASSPDDVPIGEQELAPARPTPTESISAFIPDEFIAPSVSEAERNLDPLTKRDIASIREFIPRAVELVDNGVSVRNDVERNQMIGQVARSLRDRSLSSAQAEDAASVESAEGIDPSGLGVLASNAQGLIEDQTQRGSILNSMGTENFNMGGLRNVDTVGDLFPLVGSSTLTGLGIMARRRLLPPQAQKVIERAFPNVDKMIQNRLMPPVQKMIRDRGFDTANAVVGAAIGGGLDVRLQDAADYINNGGDPLIFKDAPVIGAFLLGQTHSPFEESASRILNQAMQDALLESAGFATTQVPINAFKRLTRMAAGSEAYLRQAVDDSLKSGIPVGIVDSVEGGIAPMTRKVLGPFGLLGPAFRKALEQRASDISKASNRLATGLSTEIGTIMRMYRSDPEAAGSLMAKMNSGAFKAHGKAFNAYVRVRNKLYEQFERFATEEGVTVIPAATRANAAIKFGRLFNIPKAVKKSAKSADVKAYADMQKQGFSPEELELISKDILEEMPITDDVEVLKKTFDYISRMEPEPTVMQMSNLGQRLNLALGNVKSRIAKAAIVDVIRSIEDDIATRLTGGSEKVLDARRRAKGFTETWMNIFSGRAGQKVGRVTGDFGESTVQFVDDVGGAGEGVKNAGTVDPTEFIDMMMDQASFGEIDHIAGILRLSGVEGKTAFRNMVARRVQKAFKDAFTFEQGKGALRTTFMNSKNIAKNLGLDDPLGKKGISIIRAVSKAGGDPKAVTRILKISERVMRDGVTDSSQFAARRVILGGLSSGIGAGIGVSAQNFDRNNPTSLTAAMATALVLYGMSRGAGRLLTNPKYTRSLLQLLDPKFSNSVKTQAARRLASAGFFGTLQDLRDDEEKAKSIAESYEEKSAWARRMGADFARATSRAIEPQAVQSDLPLQRDLQGEVSPGTPVNQPLPAQRR